MTDQEPTILLCTRVEDLDDPISGSQEKVCTDCTRAVWVSPSANSAAGADPVIVCVQCGFDRIQGDPDAQIQPVTENQIEELRTHFT